MYGTTGSTTSSSALRQAVRKRQAARQASCRRSRTDNLAEMSFTAQMLSTTLAAMNFALVASDQVNAEAAGIEARRLAACLIAGDYE